MERRELGEREIVEWAKRDVKAEDIIFMYIFGSCSGFYYTIVIILCEQVGSVVILLMCFVITFCLPLPTIYLVYSVTLTFESEGICDA